MPQLGRAHFLTDGGGSGVCSLELVNNVFKDLCCLLHLRTLCVLMILFIFGSVVSKGRFCLIVVNASMLLGLWVEMYGSILGLGVLLCWLVFSVFLSSSLARFIPRSMSVEGYWRCNSVFLRSCKRISRVVGSETMVQILLAKLKGIFILVCFGWHELKRRYCCESVGLW